MNSKILESFIPLFKDKINRYGELTDEDKDKLTTFSTFANAHNIKWTGENYPWQKSLLVDIHKANQIKEKITIVGASTSFGKSHVMRQFAYSLKGQRVLFLLQEKSLINDYEREFKKFYKDISINTYINIDNMNDDGIFVLTQERCLAVDQSKLNKFDVVIIDEAQWINNDIKDIFNNDGKIQSTKFSLRRIKKFVDVLRTLSDAKIFALIPSHNKILAEKTAKTYSDIMNIEHNFILENFNITSRSGITIHRGEGKISWHNENVLPELKKKEVDDVAKLIMNNDSFIPKKTLVYLSKTKTYGMIENGMIHGGNINSAIYKTVSKIYGKKHPLSIFVSNKQAYHNGNIYPDLRKKIEESFMNNEIDVIFANQTVIKGVNIAPKYLLMRSNYFSSRQEYNYIKASNLFGRTGRISGERHGIVIIDLKNPSIFEETLRANEGVTEKDVSTLEKVYKQKDENIKKVTDLFKYDYFSSDDFDDNFKKTAKSINGKDIGSYNADIFSIIEATINSVKGNNIDDFVMKSIKKIIALKSFEVKKFSSDVLNYINFYPVSMYTNEKWEFKDEAFLRWNTVFDLIFEVGISKFSLNDVQISLLSNYRYLLSKKTSIKEASQEIIDKLSGIDDIYDLVEANE